MPGGTPRARAARPTSPPAGSATAAFLADLDVPVLEPSTSAFDPGYDPLTLRSHLLQSGHLLCSVKISMACWLVAAEQATRAKFAAAREAGVPATTGGGPLEIAVAHGRLDEYLDLCAALGATRVECSEGFTDIALDPAATVSKAAERGLEVQYELGSKHGGSFTERSLRALMDTGEAWLEAGAVELVIEARESGVGVGLFSAAGTLDDSLADVLTQRFGLGKLLFEAPTKSSQFALIRHLGARVRLGNVRLEEVLRVEIFRRGLHSDSYGEVAGALSARPPAL